MLSQASFGARRHGLLLHRMRVESAWVVGNQDEQLSIERCRQPPAWLPSMLPRRQASSESCRAWVVLGLTSSC
jgi:hypothetical protein